MPRDDDPKFIQHKIAPGAITALVGRHDRRAHFTYKGSLSQMGTMELFLRNRGMPVVKNDVYPGFKEDQEGLRLIYENDVDGWFGQREALLRYGICTESEYLDKLSKVTG